MNYMVTKFERYLRIWRVSEDKKDDEDSVELLENNNSLNQDNIRMIRSIKRSKKILQYITRIRFLSVCRWILLIPFILYVILILTPLRNLRSFIPHEINHKNRFLVVVAHPDDECLFFSPTILGLVNRGQKAHLLVFSTGNSEGLGPIREKELNGSCQRLSIDLNHCWSLNLTGLQDNPRLWWPKMNISSIVAHYVERYNIDLLITFDRGGISGHLNHRSIAAGIEHYHQSDSRHSKPAVYQLKTVPFLLEFSSIWNLLPTLVSFLPRIIRSPFSTILPFLIDPPNDERVLFISSPLSYYKGLKAFHAHRSQMLWFRHIYTTFSRHMFINELTKFSVDH